MTDQETYEIFAKMRDGFNGLALVLDEFIQKETKVVLKEYEPEKIKWTERNGAKGPYQASNDVNDPEFKALQKDLAEHKGFMVYDGWQYWVFQNSQTIGRRKKV